MKPLKNLRQRIQGWLPKEPKLPRSYASDSSEDNHKQKQPYISKRSTFGRAILLVLVFAFLGFLNLSTRQYISASLYFAGVPIVIVVSYFVYRYQFQIRPRTALGMLLIAIGIVCALFNETIVTIFGFPAVLSPLFSTFGSMFALTIAIALVVGLVLIACFLRREKVNLRMYFSKRYLLPYGISSLFIFFAYLIVISGMQFVYAIPVTFFISGILVFKGLRRFTITVPALATLLICMLVFGSAVAGAYTAVYVSSDHHLERAKFPDVEGVNLTANSVQANIVISFTDNDSEICTVSFIQGFGPISNSRGGAYYTKPTSSYEPSGDFNYTVENGVANVTASSPYLTSIKISVNQNLKSTFNCFTSFGDITFQAPSANNIDEINLTTKYGSVGLTIVNTTSLRQLSATGSSKVNANICSSGQNQNATAQLKGGYVTLNLDLTKVESKILAYSTTENGQVKASTQGFTVLNQDKTRFDAQTINYNTSPFAKLDVTAISTYDPLPRSSSLTLTANYGDELMK